MALPYHQARLQLLQHPLRVCLAISHSSCLQTSRHNSTSSSPTPNSPSQIPKSPPNSPTQTKTPRTIFSGIQPTGIPHLGNYLGALKQWVHLQDTAEKETKLLFSVVDLHAITLPKGIGELRRWKREALGILLAVGVREERSTVFFQSQVQAHTELMWILSCTASMGYLSRMTQWKSKMNLPASASHLEEGRKSKLKLGLFSYPVLQAADILVHRATHVPVGEDQSQHLEFARECVTNFNHAYGPHLVAPQTILSPVKKVMSLLDPTQKMSKSAPSPLSRILLTDTPSTISSKIFSSLTDSLNTVSYDPVNRPGVSNLISLYSYFDPEGRTPENIGAACGGIGLGAFKGMVAEAVSEGLEGVKEEYERVMREEGYLDGVAERGAERARGSAEGTMGVVKVAVGLD